MNDMFTNTCALYYCRNCLWRDFVLILDSYISMKSYLNLPECLLPLGTGHDDSAHAPSMLWGWRAAPRAWSLLYNFATITETGSLLYNWTIQTSSPFFFLKQDFQGFCKVIALNILLVNTYSLESLLLSAFSCGHYVDPGNNGGKLY